MAWRIHRNVIRGEIDNRRKGVVVGLLWVVGRADPIRLELEGNCMRDLAGTEFRFSNPAAADGEPVSLHALQKGRVGDMTASRKVRGPSNARGDGAAAVRGPLINSLYIEWFSEANGRVVIEGVGFDVTVGERAWMADPEPARNDAGANESVCNWLDELTERFEEDHGVDFGGESPMDEFEWERFMRESDARAEKFSQLFEKHLDHPDRDKIIAHEMGWSWLEEALDAQEMGGFDDAEDESLMDPAEPLTPNPLTEGRHWVRNEHGHLEHPLTMRTHRLGLDLWRQAEKVAGGAETWDKNLQDMVLKTQTTAAKLAGALNHLAYEDDPDGGFIVAALKRALNYLHEAIAAAYGVAEKNLLAEDKMIGCQVELFEIRQEILALMQEYRQII